MERVDIVSVGEYFMVEADNVLLTRKVDLKLFELETHVEVVVLRLTVPSVVICFVGDCVGQEVNDSENEGDASCDIECDKLVDVLPEAVSAEIVTSEDVVVV